jgi:hypothetical protein
LWSGGCRNFHASILPELNRQPKKLFLRRKRLHVPLDAITRFN